MVSKEDVKSFIRAVRIEMDARYSAKFATTDMLAAVMAAVGNLEGIVSELDNSTVDSSDNNSISDAALAVLMNNESFGASDVVDIFI